MTAPVGQYWAVGVMMNQQALMVSTDSGGVVRRFTGNLALENNGGFASDRGGTASQCHQRLSELD